MNDLVGDVLAVTHSLIDVPVLHRREGRETKHEAASQDSCQTTRKKPGVVSEIESVHTSDLGERRRHFYMYPLTHEPSFRRRRR